MTRFYFKKNQSNILTNNTKSLKMLIQEHYKHHAGLFKHPVYINKTKV